MYFVCNDVALSGTLNMSRVKMQLVVDVEYETNGVDSYELKLVLEHVARYAAGDGTLDGDTEAVVISWGATATEVK